MQQLVILLVLNCSSLCALCGVGCYLLHTVHTACHPTIEHHNNYNRTENHGQWNAVWPPDDGRKDARNMLRNNWLTIKSLIVASSWSRLYLLLSKRKFIVYKISRCLRNALWKILWILQCIICMYLHIHAVRNTTINRWYHYVIYITVQYTTTCFGLINGPSSGCW